MGRFGARECHGLTYDLIVSILVSLSSGPDHVSSWHRTNIIFSIHRLGFWFGDFKIYVL